MIVNMEAPQPRRRRPAKAAYHHGDLPRALVEAAWRLIEEGGAPRLTLRAAAEAAGVSAAAPYRHFVDREALLAAVLAAGFRELARRTDEARRAAREPLAGLRAVGLAYVAFAADHPRIYRLMFGGECDKARHPDLLAAGHAAMSVLIESVAACRTAGRLVTDDVLAVALAGWSLSHGLASLHADGMLAGMPGTLPDTAATLIGFLVDGVRSRPARKATSSTRRRKA